MTKENSLTVVGGSGEMFDRIASRYDRMNQIISLGLDRGWRKALVESLHVPDGSAVLDVATGTGDVAMAIANHYAKATVVGLDPSEGMLGVGRGKVAHERFKGRVRLDFGDAQDMKYETNSFSSSCISFGIRNVPDRLKGLREMVRVTGPRGKIAVLELSEPRGGILAPFARFHVHHIVPLLGALLSGEKEYRYLQKSIAAFPPAKQFATLMEEAGLEEVQVRRLFMGVAHLYVGTVPA